jgi:predicted phage tail protein
VPSEVLNLQVEFLDGAVALASIQNRREGVSFAGARATAGDGLTFRVRLTWAAPRYGAPPTEYIVEAGSQLGRSNLTSSPTGSAATSLVVDAPAGVYFVRVRGRNAFGLGPPSNEVLIQLGDTSSCTTAPAAPGGLTATADGLTVEFQWGAASGATTYLLEVGATPGGLQYGRLNTGGLPRYTATGQPGVYYVRVRGSNACGQGPASNEVTVLLTTTVAPPAAPFALTALVALNTVNLSWLAPASGGVPDTYTIEVGASPGFTTLLATQDTTSTAVVFTDAPAGTYYVRVRARNAAGPSPASNEVRVDVP